MAEVLRLGVSFELHGEGSQELMSTFLPSVIHLERRFEIESIMKSAEALRP